MEGREGGELISERGREGGYRRKEKKDGGDYDG